MNHQDLNKRIFGVPKRQPKPDYSNAVGEMTPEVKTVDSQKAEDFKQTMAELIVRIAEQCPEKLRDLLKSENVGVPTQDADSLIDEAAEWLQENGMNTESVAKLYALHPDRAQIEGAVAFLEKDEACEPEPAKLETPTTETPIIDLSVVRESEERILACVNTELSKVQQELRGVRKSERTAPTTAPQGTAPSTEKGFVTIKTDYLVYGAVALLVAGIIGYFIYSSK